MDGPAVSEYGRYMNTLTPQERLWRETIGTLAADMIRRLEAEPSAAGEGQLDYAASLARAAELLQAEAERAGAPASEPAAAVAAPGADVADDPYKIYPYKLYSAKEAAHFLAVETKEVYKLGSQKRITVTRTGGKGGGTRFQGRHLIEFIESRQTG